MGSPPRRIAGCIAAWITACTPARGTEPERPAAIHLNGAEADRPAPIGVIGTMDGDVLLPDAQSDALFDAFLAARLPVADGFDVPTGTPCGDGCWSRDTSTDVSAVAAGKIVAVGVDFVTVEHLWYDDQVKRTGWIRWEGVTPTVTAGVEVSRGRVLGKAKALRAVGSPEFGEVTPFLAGRPRLPVPQAEPVLLLVSHDLDRARLYRDGEVIGTFEVGFGQEEGDKEVRGDNKTPKGVYHVMVRSKGPFDGPVGPYYGGHWVKLGYPNPWDAARGVDAGLIDTATQRSITRAFWNRTMPPQNTALGGGIGLHGWAYEWDDTGTRGMSWGCVVLHLRDVGTIYEALEEGAMVVMF